MPAPATNVGWVNVDPAEAKRFWQVGEHDVRWQYLSGDRWYVNHRACAFNSGYTYQVRPIQDGGRMPSGHTDFYDEDPAPAVEQVAVPAPVAVEVTCCEDWPMGQVGKLQRMDNTGYNGAVVMRTFNGVVCLAPSPSGYPSRGDGWSQSGLSHCHGIKMNMTFEGEAP